MKRCDEPRVKIVSVKKKEKKLETLAIGAALTSPPPAIVALKDEGGGSARCHHRRWVLSRGRLAATRSMRGRPPLDLCGGFYNQIRMGRGSSPHWIRTRGVPSPLDPCGGRLPLAPLTSAWGRAAVTVTRLLHSGERGEFTICHSTKIPVLKCYSLKFSFPNATCVDMSASDGGIRERNGRCSLPLLLPWWE